MRMEAKQGNDDDSAANAVEFKYAWTHGQRLPHAYMHVHTLAWHGMPSWQSPSAYTRLRACACPITAIARMPGFCVIFAKPARRRCSSICTPCYGPRAAYSTLLAADSAYICSGRYGNGHFGAMHACMQVQQCQGAEQSQRLQGRVRLLRRGGALWPRMHECLISSACITPLMHAAPPLPASCTSAHASHPSLPLPAPHTSPLCSSHTSAARAARRQLAGCCLAAPCTVPRHRTASLRCLPVCWLWLQLGQLEVLPSGQLRVWRCSKLIGCGAPCAVKPWR